jgi:hypothetical protein
VYLHITSVESSDNFVKEVNIKGLLEVKNRFSHELEIRKEEG